MFRSGLLLLRLWTLWATHSVVHKSTAGAFGFSQMVILMGDRAEHDRAIADGPAGSVLTEADRLTHQGLVEIDRAVTPSDVSVVAHAAYFVVLAIFRLAQDAVEASRRRRVVVSWRGVAERLMRPLFVVEIPEGKCPIFCVSGLCEG